MHDLAALTPLGGDGPRIERVGALTITEVVDRALASVTTRRGQEGDFASAAKGLFGIDPPGPGHWASGPVWSLIWTGPQQWLAEAPFATHEDVARIAKAALGASASVTEQTDGWARFDVEGPTVLDLMERLCALPTRHMAEGDASRSIVEHIGTLVICRAAGQHFSLLVPRSYAGSMHHTLLTAARSLG